MCDLGLGIANCETGVCGGGTVANGVVYRGSYENPLPGDCETYFRCNAGYYKWFSSFATTGCQPCAGKDGLARYVTGGLSANDPGSCLWECDTSKQNTNWSSAMGACVFLSRLDALPVHSSGWYGSEGAVAFMPRSCPPLFTTEENTALRAAECLACPELVPNGRAVAGARNCEWVCSSAGLTRIGERCVLEYGAGWACDAAGWTKASGGDGRCVRSTVPWNRAGFRKTATRVRVSGAARGSNASSPRAGGLVASSAVGGVGGRHTVRVFGSAMSSTTEGPLCTMTRVWAGGNEYVVGAVCNQSFLAHLRISEIGLNSSGRSTPRRLGVLIGQPGNPGWADGFKTQARFGVELYVTSGLRNGTVWVLDRWNCVLREVVVWRTPGDYRTRVYTVHGLTDKFALVPPEPKCYGPGSLAEPRQFWEVSESSSFGVVLFSDDNGLWQLDMERGTLTAVMGEGWAIGWWRFEADELVSVRMPDAFTLLLGFRDGWVWTVLASEAACPDDSTSNAGGDCVVGCSWPGSYVNSTTGACVPCALSGGCEAGQQWVQCTRSAQSQCASCPPLSVLEKGLVGRIFVTPGDCDTSRMRFTPPCPRNFYTTSDYVAPNRTVYCDMCPSAGFSLTLHPGATRVQQCKCSAGLRRSREGICIGEALYSYEDGVCVSSPQRCQSPPRNALVRDWGDGFGRCMWECDAGYYHATNRTWADKCQLCTRVGNESLMRATSRGDDDTPLSCEFGP